MPDNLIVSIDDGFRDGDTNDSFFKDLRLLNDQELKALSAFIVGVKEGRPLPGKNKESWLDDSLWEIPGTRDYRDLNYWHYHCGPSYSSRSGYSFTVGLERNIYGLTSPEIIHYQKSGNEIVIVGFSPKHIPFPRADDESNPLFFEM
jgi:hypothetical protein